MGNATPFQRIWCNFELDKTIMKDMQYIDRGKRLDIATKIDKPRLLTSHPLPGEQLFDKTEREQKFPLKLLSHGHQVQIENSNASVEKDRHTIFQSISTDGGRRSFTHELLN